MSNRTITTSQGTFKVTVTTTPGAPAWVDWKVWNESGQVVYVSSVHWKSSKRSQMMMLQAEMDRIAQRAEGAGS